MKIHAWIARHSNISRREAERLVQAGHVTVNGDKAHVGQVVDGSERIMVSDQLIRSHRRDVRLLLLNKADGTVCSNQSEKGLPSVLEGLPKISQGKWIMVGRLDVMTTGLLLLTNDGGLAQHFAHPSNGYEREYLVRIDGVLSPQMIKKLKQGIEMEEGLAKFHKIEAVRKKGDARNHWYRVMLRQGRYRMVRRLMASLGFEVSRLKRIRFGPFVLDRALGIGQYQEVDAKWLDQFLAQRKT